MYWPDTCGPNSRISECASPCPPTCSNPKPICIAGCVLGCVCSPGFIDDGSGKCIPEFLCPKGECRWRYYIHDMYTNVKCFSDFPTRFFL